MNNFDYQGRLNLMGQIASLGMWGYPLIFLGTIGLAIYKKKRGGNYKLVIIIGTGIFFLYGLISAVIANYLISPIYNLGN